MKNTRQLLLEQKVEIAKKPAWCRRFIPFKDWVHSFGSWVASHGKTGNVSQRHYLHQQVLYMRQSYAFKQVFLEKRVFGAAVLTEIMPFVDYAVDFHAGGASRFNAPGSSPKQSRVKRISRCI
jgi:hypothetical protein